MAVKSGDKVQIHYTGKLEDGTVLESSRSGQPFELVLGAGQVIRGLEKAVQGMEPGESKSVHVAVDDAFGARQPDMVLELDREKLPADVDAQVGQDVTLNGRDGKAIPAKVIDISESTVTVDANHPLAGKDLVFEIELVNVV